MFIIYNETGDFVHDGMQIIKCKLHFTKKWGLCGLRTGTPFIQRRTMERVALGHSYWGAHVAVAPGLLCPKAPFILKKKTPH